MIRLIFKTSSVTPEFSYVFNLILSFSTCSQSFKKICTWELLGANIESIKLIDSRHDGCSQYVLKILVNLSLSVLIKMVLIKKSVTEFGKMEIRSSKNTCKATVLKRYFISLNEVTPLRKSKLKVDVLAE